VFSTNCRAFSWRLARAAKKVNPPLTAATTKSTTGSTQLSDFTFSKRPPKAARTAIAAASPGDSDNRLTGWKPSRFTRSPYSPSHEVSAEVMKNP